MDLDITFETKPAPAGLAYLAGLSSSWCLPAANSLFSIVRDLVIPSPCFCSRIALVYLRLAKPAGAGFLLSGVCILAVRLFWVGAKGGEDCKLLKISLVSKLAGAALSIQTPID